MKKLLLTLSLAAGLQAAAQQNGTLVLDTANPITGGGTMDVYLIYEIVKL